MVFQVQPGQRCVWNNSASWGRMALWVLGGEQPGSFPIHPSRFPQSSLTDHYQAFLWIPNLRLAHDLLRGCRLENLNVPPGSDIHRVKVFYSSSISCWILEVSSMSSPQCIDGRREASPSILQPQSCIHTHAPSTTPLIWLRVPR